MIKFEKYKLENDLRVIIHQDKSTPLACINILYDVGSRDENPEQTGFAHLFEHLMFGGSVNIPSLLNLKMKSCLPFMPFSMCQLSQCGHPILLLL